MFVDRYKSYIPHLGILLLPFCLLYWLVPGISDLTIGHDYVRYAVSEQLELQFALRHGDFPLFVPGFACGRTVAALTLGQLFHPLPHLAAGIPGYFDGAALTIVTMLRLASLGIAQLLLYLLLGRLNLAKSIAFILSLITVYNLRMLDLFRYGASLENYTGQLYLVAALGFYFIKPSPIWGPLSIVIATFLLITGGHPQMMYFGLLTVGIVALAVPFVVPAVASEFQSNKVAIARYYKIVAFCLLSGAALSTAYTLPFVSQFLSDNAIRVNRGYAWSLSNSDNWGGTLGNFFFPLRSDVHGAFGGTALILLIFTLPLLRLRKAEIPKIIWILYGVFVAALLCGTGRLTPLHYLFWKLLPMASSFRTPGRINMMLPVLMLFLLAFLFSRKPMTIPFLGRRLTASPALLPALGALILYGVYFAAADLLPPLSRWTPDHIVSRPPWVDILWALGGVVVLVSAGFSAKTTHRRPVLLFAVSFALCAAVILQTGIALRFGTWQTQREDSRTYEDYLKEKHTDIRSMVTSGYGMESARITEQIETSILEPKLAKLYRNYVPIDTEDHARQFILTNRRADQGVVVAPVEAPASCPDQADDTATLTFSNYNQLVFQVDAKCGGLLTMSFPYTPDWQAEVDGTSAAVYLSNGYELGVIVPKGTHRVEFRFQAESHIIGLSISGFTFALLGLLFARNLRGKSHGFFYTVTAAAVLSGILIVALPIRGLYSGASFGEAYRWTSRELPPKDNLAYAKRTGMAPMQSNENPYYHYSGLAVDGNRDSRGFLTSKNRSGFFEVDLGGRHSIHAIDIYGDPDTALPLIVSVASEFQNFTPIHTIEKPTESGTWHVPTDVTARYLRISRIENGSLSLREVEVY